MTSVIFAIWLVAQTSDAVPPGADSLKPTGRPSISATENSATPKSIPAAKYDRNQIVARVGDRSITVGDVDLQLGRQPAADGSFAQLPRGILLATIYIIAQQRRSLETLTRTGVAVSARDVDVWLEENNPAREDQSGAELARRTAKSAGVSESSFRDLMTWRISWQRYLAKHLTEENMAKHFQKHSARFDGSRFRIDHVYLPTTPGLSEERSTARQKLQQLREQLTSGELDFAAAAKGLDSIEPLPTSSAVAKYEPLWVSGSGPLHPAVLDAVIKLKPTEISPVVDSPVGVHVMRLIEVEPGTKRMEEVVDGVRRHMLLYLLDFSANQSAAKMPLVVAKQSAD